MQQLTSFTAPRENLFAVLAASARSLSPGRLALLAALSGVVALVATLVGGASWMLLGACYVLWTFSGWGILFRRTEARPAAWHALELTMIVSGTAVALAISFGLFFWALGSHWQL